MSKVQDPRNRSNPRNLHTTQQQQQETSNAYGMKAASQLFPILTIDNSTKCSNIHIWLAKARSALGKEFGLAVSVLWKKDAEGNAVKWPETSEPLPDSTELRYWLANPARLRANVPAEVDQNPFSRDNDPTGTIYQSWKERNHMLCLEYHEMKSKEFQIYEALLTNMSSESQCACQVYDVDDWKRIKDEQDIVGLLRVIRHTHATGDLVRGDPELIEQVEKELARVKMTPIDDIASYHDRFLRALDNYDINGIEKPAENRLACKFIGGLDANRYASLLQFLKNDKATGKGVPNYALLWYRST
jgi:hypothetical protein